MQVVRPSDVGWPALKSSSIDAPSLYLFSIDGSRQMNNFQWQASDFNWVRYYWHGPAVFYARALTKHAGANVSATDGHALLVKTPVAPTATGTPYLFAPSPCQMSTPDSVADLRQIEDSRAGAPCWGPSGGVIYVRNDSNKTYGF